VAIQKQEFYEGAALHQLLRRSGRVEVDYSNPFFVVDRKISVYFKYSTSTRTPWGFSFPEGERQATAAQAKKFPLVYGLVCGGDGVVALPHGQFRALSLDFSGAVWLSCSRRHREHFEVSGPYGKLPFKIAPSAWPNLLMTDWTLERGLRR
jgi:hypothetical protein